MDVTISVPDEIGKKVKKLPNKILVQALENALDKFQSRPEQKPPSDALINFLKLEPVKMKKSAVDTVREGREKMNVRI